MRYKLLFLCITVFSIGCLIVSELRWLMKSKEGKDADKEAEMLTNDTFASQ